MVKDRNDFPDTADQPVSVSLASPRVESGVTDQAQDIRSRRNDAFAEQANILGEEEESFLNQFLYAASDNPIVRGIQKDIAVQKYRKQLNAEGQQALSEGNHNPSFSSNILNFMEQKEIPRKYWTSIAVNSSDEAEVLANWEMVQRIEREKSLVTSGGAGLAGGLVSGILSPLTVVGGAVPAFSARFMAQNAIKGLSKPALNTARRSAALSAVGAAGDEALLNKVDLTRTEGEAITNIATAGVLGGAVGGIVGANVASKVRRQQVQIAEFLDGRRDKLDFDFEQEMGDAVLGSMFGVFGDSSPFKAAQKAYNKVGKKSADIGRELAEEVKSEIGAARSTLEQRRDILRNAMENAKMDLKDLRPNDYQIFSDTEEKVILSGTMRLATKDLDSEIISSLGVAPAFKRLSPIFYGMQARSPAARQMTASLWESNLLKRSNFADVKTELAASTEITNIQGRAAELMQKNQEHYAEYLKHRQELGDTNVITFQEFKRRVSLSKLTGQKSDLFEVNMAVRSADNYFKFMEQEALDSTLLRNPQLRENFLPIRYLKDKIKAEPFAFKRKLNNTFVASRDIAKKRIEAAEAKGQKVPKMVRDTANIADSELDKLVDSYFDSITGNKFAQLDASEEMLAGAAGTFKGRAFDLDYAGLADFIDLDIDSVAFSYSRNVAPDIALYRRFKSVDLKEQKRQIADEYDILISEAKQSQKAQLELEKKRILENIDFSVKALRNRTDFNLETSEMVRTGVKLANSLAFMRFMGMFLIATIPELALPAVNNGFAKTWGRAMRDFKGLAQEIKLSKDQATVLNIATDGKMATRMNALTDATMLRGGETGFEQKLDKAQAFFANMFGMPLVNDTMRTASLVFNRSILRDDMQTLLDGKLSRQRAAELANLGIDKDMAKKFLQQLKKHGETDENGIFFDNSEAWPRSIARQWEGTLLKAVNNDVLMPTAGNLPKLAQTPAGKIVTFLRTYTMAATERIMAANAQRLSPQRAQAISGFIAMGLLSHISYETIKGREVNWDNPEELINGAIYRSGILGLGYDIADLSNRIYENPEISNIARNIGGASGANIIDTAEFATSPTGYEAKKIAPAQNFVGFEVIRRISDSVNTQED